MPGSGTSATATRSEQGVRPLSAERRRLWRGASQLRSEGQLGGSGVPPPPRLAANVQPHDVRREGLRRTTEAARRAAVHAVPATSTATAMAFVTRGPTAVDRRVAGPQVAGRADSLAGQAISTATTTAAAMSNPHGGENASTPTYRGAAYLCRGGRPAALSASRSLAELPTREPPQRCLCAVGILDEHDTGVERLTSSASVTPGRSRSFLSHRTAARSAFSGSRSQIKRTTLSASSSVSGGRPTRVERTVARPPRSRAFLNQR